MFQKISIGNFQTSWSSCLNLPYLQKPALRLDTFKLQKHKSNLLTVCEALWFKKVCTKKIYIIIFPPWNRDLQHNTISIILLSAPAESKHREGTHIQYTYITIPESGEKLRMGQYLLHINIVRSSEF